MTDISSLTDVELDAMIAQRLGESDFGSPKRYSSDLAIALGLFWKIPGCPAIVAGGDYGDRIVMFDRMNEGSIDIRGRQPRNVARGIAEAFYVYGRSQSNLITDMEWKI